MTCGRITAILLALGLLLSLTQAADPGAPSPELIVLKQCRAEYREATNLGSTVAGILQDCLVELGDRVKAGQILGRLQDIEQKAGIDVAEARYKLAAVRVKTASPLVGTGAISKDDFNILEGEKEASFMTLRAAQASAHVRELVSPYDGIVVAVYKARGEAVNYTQDPVFRVVNPNVVRVTGFLDVGDAWRVRPGQPVRVTPEFAGPDLAVKHEVFTGKVVFVDQEIDPRTQTCKVVADVNNRDNLLRSGLEVRMEIQPGPGADRLRAPSAE